jgi:hypothetical protein
MRVLVALDLGGVSGLLRPTREVCANCVEKRAKSTLLSPSLTKV